MTSETANMKTDSHSKFLYGTIGNQVKIFYTLNPQKTKRVFEKASQGLDNL